MKSNKWVAPLVVVVLIVFGLYYSFKGEPTPESATVVNEDGSRTYVNPVIGLSFDYPLDWTLNDNIVHGDNEQGAFQNALTSAESGMIRFYHSPVASAEGDSYDNMSVNSQVEAVPCTAANHCETLTNANGVKYLRSTTCGKDGCFISSVVPTGKYIMTFIISADGLLRAPDREPTFKALVDSIQII
jgi:hypothetical protein